jgi:nicotinamide-nucleotide amidase
MPNAILLLIGDELTTGALADTNGSFLSARLGELGVTTVRFEIVRDRINEIVPALRRADSDILIISGGLGPTSDDLTRDAVAEFLGEPLIENSQSRAKLERCYSQRALPLNSISLRQAFFPASAEVISNSVGTADAFCVRRATGNIFSLPGVPRELRQIFEEEVAPRIRRLFPGLRTNESRVIRTFGLSESAVGEAIEKRLKNSRVAYRASFPETFVKLYSEEGKDIDLLQEEAISAIGKEYVISLSEGESVANVVVRELGASGHTLSLAESCTGGLGGGLITSVPGASAVFLGGIVCYSNGLKTRVLGSAAVESKGAVSPEVALELAAGVRQLTGSSIGVSVTGIAGPEGGSAEKPVGTVYFGYSREGFEQVVKHHLPFDRNRIQKYSSYLALDLVRRDLLGYPLEFNRR